MLAQRLHSQGKNSNNAAEMLGSDSKTARKHVCENIAKTIPKMSSAVSGKHYRKYIAALIRLQTRAKGEWVVTINMVKKEADVVQGDQTIRNAFRNHGAGRKLMQPSNAQASMPACGSLFAADANLQQQRNGHQMEGVWV